jgi:hypothetical protein
VGDDAPSVLKAVSRHNGAAIRVVWQPWTSRGMWPLGVVVRHPLGQHVAQMPFIQRSDPVEALAPCGADKPFAGRVRLRARDGVRRTSTDIDLSASSTAGAKMASRSWTTNR